MAGVYCLAQSDDGYIWIGTDGGDLYRYDGSEFTEMQDKNGDNNHHYRNLFLYGDSILFSSLYKGYFSYSRSNKTITRLNIDAVKAGDAIAAYRVKDDYYFVGTNAIFIQSNGRLKELFSIIDNGDDIHVFQTIKTDEAIFIFTNHGVFRLGEQKITPLEKWINSPIANLSDFKFGYYTHGKLTIYTDRFDRKIELITNTKGEFFSMKESSEELFLKDNETVHSFSYNPTSEKQAILTKNGRIYEKIDFKFSPILHNYSEPLSEAQDILTDINGDYWVSSHLKGVYKVSLEAFTQIQILPIYKAPNISFPYETIDNEIIISLMNGETFVRSKSEGGKLNKYDFIVHGIAVINDTYYAATNVGVKKFHPKNASSDFTDVYFKNQNITFIYANDIYLWVGLAGKGLVRINTKTEEVNEFTESTLPNYFYTCQVTKDNNNLFFGTNNGIYKFTKSTSEFYKMKIDYNSLGGYSGVSTQDSHGTNWFTLSKGIIGITNNGETVTLIGQDYFTSNLFFTLNSDRFGNIILGTNKGITILKTNPAGEIISNKHYNDNSGFNGYETHMRSQFQNQNHNRIVVGTVEGLFYINTSILEELSPPLPPVIENEHLLTNTNETISNSYSFVFKVNNPKKGKIIYQYRLKKHSKNWTTLDNDNVVHFTNLSNGKYILEVESSYDGIHFSQSSYKTFTIKLPIWRSNWFIITVILIVVGFNILLLKFNKSFEINSLIEINSNKANTNIKMTPAILLFGAITIVSAQLAAPMLNAEISLHLEQILIVGFSLITLFFLALSAKKNGNEHLFPAYLLIGITLIGIHIFIELFLSKLHPFHIIALIITSSIIPYIFAKVKSVIIYALLIFTFSIILVVVLNNTAYPKSYFLIAIFATTSLIVFLSYLRFESQEKMIFISEIINKGNIPAIAFNKKGTIIYASENVSKFIGASHEELVNNNVACLNNHIPFDGNYQTFEVLNDFKDGNTYTVPLASSDNIVRWIEWAYKDFTNDIKVILGQDITEKLELENTYELLVQNAEDFIYRCDVDGNFKFLNDICYTKLGYTEEDLIGKPSLSIVPSKYAESVELFYNNHFSEGRKSSYKEFPIKNKSGDIIWIGQFVTTIYAAGSDSYVNGYIALARDITARREQQKLIKNQRDNITSSINYAKRIQFNLLPHPRKFIAAFKEHFIVYKPKDIVSGDFYWMEKIDGRTIIALADCTGHGVPGSFMSLLGINLLNSIVLESKITDPAKILNELDRRLIEILQKSQGGNNVNDAMEVTICEIDDNSSIMSYSCAGSRFLIKTGNDFTMFKGDNKHIGDLPYDGFEAYHTSHTEFKNDDQIYLFTDGFQDQFGSENDKKFSFRRMLEIFESNHDKSLVDQKTIIEKEFDNWIGKREQTDDVTLISIKKKH